MDEINDGKQFVSKIFSDLSITINFETYNRYKSKGIVFADNFIRCTKGPLQILFLKNGIANWKDEINTVTKLYKKKLDTIQKI